MSCKSEIIDGKVLRYGSSQSSPSALRAIAGHNADHDEETDLIPKNANYQRSTTKSSGRTIIPTTTNTVQGKNVSRVPISFVDYNYKLSSTITVRNMTTGTTFPHSLRAQNGLTLTDLVYNMSCLATNVLEPIKKQFPGMKINSGFRQGSGRSQHPRGQAADLQWPGKGPSYYNEVARWIMRNLPFDQMIMEHGNSIWIHISYNPNQLRKKLTTYYKGRYTSGLYNYYSGGRVA
jgi:hypothetical protein